MFVDDDWRGCILDYDLERSYQLLMIKDFVYSFKLFQCEGSRHSNHPLGEVLRYISRKNCRLRTFVIIVEVRDHLISL